MSNTFSKSCNNRGCAPTVRNTLASVLLPAFNAYSIKYILLFSFCLLSFVFLPAQRYTFNTYTTANGLGSSSINHIFQDSKGYIWFATQGGGASRFNGKEFKNFTKRDGLICNDVTCITQDKTGNIWIGTAEGASVFDGNKFTNYNQSNGLTNGVVYCIYADAQNKLWFATQDAGIKILNNNKFDSLTTKNGLPSNEAYTITQDKQSNYWFGLYKGFAKYSKGKITAYPYADKTFFSSLADAKGNIWLGTTSGLVVAIHTNDSVETLSTPALVKNDFIGSIAEDKKGNLWFATDHGLLKYTPDGGGNFKLFSEHQGLSANAVQTVMVDYEDNVWAGTLSGGANLLTGEAFVHYTYKDGLTSQNITAVCAQPNSNTYFIGTGEGLFIYSNGLFKKVNHIKQIEKVNISSLSFDHTGCLWVTAQEGAYVLANSNDTWKLKKSYTQIAGNRLVSALKAIHDTNGNHWIATYGSGLFTINNQTEKAYNTSTGFASDKILTVFEDSRQNIWAGTQDAGLLKFNGQNFISVPVSDKAIWSIAEDDKDHLFLGTGESGLIILGKQGNKNYTVNDGLSSNYLPVLLWNKQQNCLWLAGESGLDKLQLKPDLSIAKIHTYKEQDGFSAVTINQNGAYIDTQGTLWLGTGSGLWQFNHQYEFNKNIPPKIQLNTVRLFYGKENLQPYYTGAELTLPYNKNHLTFDIRALTTANVSYLIKLEGQDDDWLTPTKNNEITYSNISPGKTYTFKAKAVNAEGIESTDIIAFKFTVKAPWWKTWWFYLLMLVSIITGLIFFIKTRERLLREQNIKLEQTVTQRTLVIEQQKETVEKMLSEKEVLLKEIHHRVKNNLQTISSMLMLQSVGLKDAEAKKAITESQSRVRSIALVHQKLYQTDGLEKVELNGFVKDLTEQIKSLYRSQSKHITIHQSIPETYILIDIAIPLGLVINELFTNSFKYAFSNNEKGSIEILLHNIDSSSSSKTKKVTLTYRDSGPGLASPELIHTSTTLGLRLIKLLSQQIGAITSYSNTNGSEFTFTFSINI